MAAFKIVPGYPAYEISRAGTVRHHLTGHIKKPFIFGDCKSKRYLLTPSTRGSRQHRISQLKLLSITFGIPRPMLWKVNQGEKVPSHKLKAVEIPIIRSLGTRYTTADISRRYSVAYSTIRDVLKHKTWRSIK